MELKNVSKEYHGYLIDKNIYFINKAYRKEWFNKFMATANPVLVA